MEISRRKLWRARNYRDLNSVRRRDKWRNEKRRIKGRINLSFVEIVLKGNHREFDSIHAFLTRKCNLFFERERKKGIFAPINGQIKVEGYGCPSFIYQSNEKSSQRIILSQRKGKMRLKGGGTGSKFVK